MSITVENLSRQFNNFRALDGVSLDVKQGEFVALLGPSGSGKTTLLRIIAGLDFADGGAIRFDGQDLSGVSARERQVGFVFQHYALFRHMTIADNIAFGLNVRPRNQRPLAAEIQRRVQELLRLVQLEGLAGRFPAQLSGGQRQRVALARALAIEPKVLLLDEPFGALDARVRKDLRRWLRRLHDEMGLMSIFVTHDQEEALELADRVVVMDRGRIQQVGAPAEVYRNPANPFVYEFLGNAARLDCRVSGDSAEIDGIRIPLHGQDRIPDGNGILFVRPEDLSLVPLDQDEALALSGRIVQVFRAGPRLRVEVERNHSGEILTVELPADQDADWLRIGAPARVAVHSARVFAS